MRIGVDLDDVLADLIAELLRTHREMNGVALTREQATDWGVFPPPVHDRVRAEGYGRLAPLPGAREFLAGLRPRHELLIVTYRRPDAEAVTRAWLDRHLPGLHDDIRFTAGSKVEACRELRVDVLVDDSCHHLPEVTRTLGVPGILIETPMNRHIANSPLLRRARDLAAADEWLRQLEAGAWGGPRAARG